MCMLQASPSRSSGLCSQWWWVHPSAGHGVKARVFVVFALPRPGFEAPHLLHLVGVSGPGAVLSQPALYSVTLGSEGDSRKLQHPFRILGRWSLVDAVVVAESVSPLSLLHGVGQRVWPIDLQPGPALFQMLAYQCVRAKSSGHLCTFALRSDWFITWSVSAASLEDLCSVALCPASESC